MNDAFTREKISADVNADVENSLLGIRVVRASSMKTISRAFRCINEAFRQSRKTPSLHG